MEKRSPSGELIDLITKGEAPDAVGLFVNPFTCNPRLRYAIFTAIQRAQI